MLSASEVVVGRLQEGTPSGDTFGGGSGVLLEDLLPDVLHDGYTRGVDEAKAIVEGIVGEGIGLVRC